MTDEMILVPRAELLAWAKAWLYENDPGDGTDCVTPFDWHLLKTPAEAQAVACDWPSCDCTNGRAECGRKISRTSSAPAGADESNLMARLDAIHRQVFGKPYPAPVGAEGFVVRHYTGAEGPTIKGNGFDGLRVGEDRDEAEEFIRWVNAALAQQPEPVAPVGVESHVKALRELRDTGDVSDWRLLESALDIAIAALTQQPAADNVPSTDRQENDHE